MVITVYVCIHDNISWMISWHVNARRLIPAVIIVYIYMHGDTYVVMSWHIDMTGDNPPDKGKE